MKTLFLNIVFCLALAGCSKATTYTEVVYYPDEPQSATTFECGKVGVSKISFYPIQHTGLVQKTVYCKDGTAFASRTP